jgi:hypothetical protein
MPASPRRPAAILVLSAALTAASASAAPPDAGEFFEREVRPLLTTHCLNCHGDKKAKGDLRLNSRENLLRGGENGPAAVPGQPDQSRLIQAIRYTDLTLKMPPKGRMSDREVAALTRWVKDGLVWPAATAASSSAAEARHWSFQPVRSVTPPPVHDAAWVRNDIDRFILAGLEANGLRPAPPADRRTLIRRATFDLTGLPPTPEEVEAFVNDPAPDAFARVIDRLLASPAYGERWGRHWLDLVRYTDSFDSRGIGGAGDCSEAWRYRDWVIRAFNEDRPYDRFVRDQVAGDLSGTPEGTVATGMLAIGNWGGGDADKEKLLTDIADDQVDVVCRTFLGLTVACARCHDHKFDPIPTADYYGLAGIFFSTHILPSVGPKTDGPPMLRIPIDSPEERRRREERAARIKELEKRSQAARESHSKALADQLRPHTVDYVLAAWDYEHRPADQRGLGLAEFAAKRGLHAFALRRWLDRLGLGDDRLLDRPIRDVNGRAGVHGWNGGADTPSMLINTTAQEQAILTFKLPPRSVSVHPGPTGPVVLTWTSPVSAFVSVKGRLADGDSTCGDGVAWALDLRRAGGRAELASGDIPNGGSQSLTEGSRASALAGVKVEPGDRLELLVLPKATHFCDTTVVNLTITTADGSQSWDVARDLTGAPTMSNPQGPWRVADAAGRGRAKANPAVRAWQGAAAAAHDRAALESAAKALAAAIPFTDADNPFRIAEPADEAALPAEARAELQRLRADLDAVRKTPEPPPLFANGAQEGGVPGSPQAGVHDVRVHIRGRYDRLGDPVPRHFPVVLAGEKQPAITQGSGRRELADWLTRPDHPLTARVMVNRIWQHHFGAALVRTPSNFGKLGEKPTHPELLDFLAGEFVRGGWSVKRMHRLMMLSATYQQASRGREPPEKDPDNRLFGRMERHRLEAEAVRDSLLAVAGRLDRTTGGPADRDFNRPRRTVYQITVRSDRSGFGPLFDAADPTAPAEQRTESTVAPQALFLLNHPFARDQAKAMAKRLLSEKAADDAGRIDRAYRLAYGRPPTAEEVRVGRELLGPKPDEAAWAAYCQVLLCANEFLFVD